MPTTPAMTAAKPLRLEAPSWLVLLDDAGAEVDEVVPLLEPEGEDEDERDEEEVAAAVLQGQ